MGNARSVQEHRGWRLRLRNGGCRQDRGVTGWLRAAALAESAGLPLSSHLYPEISAHLLAVSPTGHWLEYVDWANPILEEPLRIEDGRASASDAAGIGLRWNEEGIQRYLVK